MKEFVFITDLHFKNSSNVRSGDLLNDLATKMDFVVNYTNQYNATLLIGGDIFDKPSVPDIVKNRLAPLLLKLVNKPLAISGNHDRLYDNDDFINKTSFQTWVTHNVISSLDNTTVDFGECFVSNETPIIQRGKPQIVLFHGFLNQEDGRNTFHYQDISPTLTDKVFLLLGHDHCVYDPIEIGSVKIFRPGSFCRITRDETSNRVPSLLHIRVQDGKLKYKVVPISNSRPYDDVFKTKLKTITKSQQADTYEDIISQIRNANVGELTFEQALLQVSDDEVTNYAMTLLQESRNNKQFDRNKI